MSKNFTYNNNQKLKSRKAIESLFAEGKVINIAPLRANWLLTDNNSNDVNKLLCSVGVSKRYFKKAVERNRIKRLMREAWRLQKNGLEENLQGQKKLLHVFINYTGQDMPEYKTVFEKTGAIIEKLLERANG